MSKLVISAIGQDQPGIVGAFTQVLFENHCNIEDTSMTLLEDHFTMLYIIQAPPTFSLEKLSEKLQHVLKNFKLHMDIHPIETKLELKDSAGRPWMISVSGEDQTGIMCHVARYLAIKQINIRHLSSKKLSRPNGEILFLMALEVDVPASIEDEILQRDLMDLAEREFLEIHAEPLEVHTL